MALKGNLRDFTITQLLNLIHLARKTGVLVLEGASENVHVYFREGKLACAQAGKNDDSLVNILHSSGKLTAGQHRAIKERAGIMTDKELGLLLVNANYISQQEILYSLQTHYINTISRLFTWPEGIFYFEVDCQPPKEKIALRISLENIILEGSRQARELEQLQDEIPSLDISLKFADRPGANIRNVHLNTDEWRVVSYINPKNTLQQIAQTTRLNDLEIRRIVYSLLQAGLVEFIRSPVSPVYARAITPGIPKATKEEQRSLINRIIQRVRSL